MPRRLTLAFLPILFALSCFVFVLPASAATTATVTNGGNFRSAPRIVAANVLGQICPGDVVTILGRQSTWVNVKLTERISPDCDPAHVAAGSVGWLSATLIRVGSAAAPAPTARPAQPTPVAAAGVTITREPGAVRRGAMAAVAAHAAPNTACDITVRYKSGPSKAAGLTSKTTSASGAISWTWKVGTNTTRGAWPVIITCGNATAQTEVNVQ